MTKPPETPFTQALANFQSGKFSSLFPAPKYKPKSKLFGDFFPANSTQEKPAATFKASSLPSSVLTTLAAPINAPQTAVKNPFANQYVESIFFAIPQSFITALLTQPSYNAKTILQTSPRKQGFLTPLQKLYQQHGIRGMFLGCHISLIKLMAHNAVVNPVALACDQVVDASLPSSYSPFSTIIKATMTSAAKTAILNPLEVLFVQSLASNSSAAQLIQRLQEKHPTFYDQLRQVYTGSALEFAKNIGGFCVIFAVKDYLEKFNASLSEEDKEQKLSNADKAFVMTLGGVVKSLATHPLDTVQKILQKEESINTVKEAFSFLQKRAAANNISTFEALFAGGSHKVAQGTISSLGMMLVMAAAVAREKSRQESRER